MNTPEAHQFWNHCDIHRVILLGDRDTLAQIAMLERQAAEHGAMIVESHAFEPGEARSNDDLPDVPAAMDALRRSIEIRADIWVPHHIEDLTREEHIRRIDLFLEQYGLDLLIGQHLAPCPEDGINPADYALRHEVRAVYDLNRAVLAAAGLRTLAEEIETALAKAASGNPDQTPDDDIAGPLAELEARYGPLPSVPAAAAPWADRREPLKEVAAELADRGLTQAKIAEILHGLGHRPPGGGAFTQVAVSGLLRGRYDRGAIR